MTKSTIENPSGRHPDLWRVEANRWVYSEFGSVYHRLLTPKRERGPGVEVGEVIEAIDVPDRATAVAIAHELLDQHAGEATGRTGLEVHVRPPEANLMDLEVYEVPPEVVARARQLGLKGGDLTGRIRQLVVAADSTEEAPANLRATGGILLRLQGGKVNWIGLSESERRHRRGKRSL